MSNEPVSLAEIGKSIKAWKETLRDRGRRRHVSWGADFDARANIISMEIQDHWKDEVKEQWSNSKARIRLELIGEFGEFGIDEKIDNFVLLGTKPFSILSHHNQFFQQIRHSYVVGAYYPALVAACTLGERILNHLIIDLREFYSATPEYRHVYRKNSFDNWDIPINALVAWGVLLPDVALEFMALKSLRHRSIHFNVETYATIKDDALAASLHLRKIIDRQFGAHGLQPWFLKGTSGHQFIAQEWEEHPFIQTYFFHNCPFVGPYFSMEHGESGWQFIDTNYGEGEWNDEKFAEIFTNRQPEMLARKIPVQDIPK